MQNVNAIFTDHSDTITIEGEVTSGCGVTIIHDHDGRREDCGSGTYNGCVEDCTADLGDSLYARLDEALQAVEVDDE